MAEPIGSNRPNRDHSLTITFLFSYEKWTSLHLWLQPRGGENPAKKKVNLVVACLECGNSESVRHITNLKLSMLKTVITSTRESICQDGLICKCAHQWNSRKCWGQSE